MSVPSMSEQTASLTVPPRVYQVGYLVRYQRIGEHNYFFSFDRASAEEYAVKHHGTVHIMLEQP
jgi:hypothetical protein